MIPIKYTLTGADNRELGVDASTYALETIDYAHHEIHSGSHFYIQGYLTLALEEGAGEGTYYVKMTTSNSSKLMHFVFDIKSTGICTTYLDEGATGGMADGSPVTPINNNRTSSKTSGATFTSGVTVATSYDTRLENDKWGADGFKESIGGGSGRDDELVLKPNTTYLRTFISGTADNIVQFKASWYEHSDKE